MFGWDGTLKTIQFQHPATVRDTFYYLSLLQTLSNLDLDTSRDPGATKLL